MASQDEKPSSVKDEQPIALTFARAEESLEDTHGFVDERLFWLFLHWRFHARSLPDSIEVRPMNEEPEFLETSKYLIRVAAIAYVEPVPSGKLQIHFRGEGATKMMIDIPADEAPQFLAQLRKRGGGLLK